MTNGPILRALKIKAALITIVVFLGLIFNARAARGQNLVTPTVLVLEVTLVGILESALFTLMLDAPVNLRRRFVQKSLLLALVIATNFTIPVILYRLGLRSHRSYDFHLFHPLHNSMFMLAAAIKEVLIFVLPATFARLSIVDHPQLGKVWTKQRYGTPGFQDAPPGRVRMTPFMYLQYYGLFMGQWRVLKDSLTFVFAPTVPALGAANKQWTRTVEAAQRTQEKLGRALMLILTGRPQVALAVAKKTWQGLSWKHLTLLNDNFYYLCIISIPVLVTAAVISTIWRTLEQYQSQRAQARLRAGVVAGRQEHGT